MFKKITVALGFALLSFSIEASNAGDTPEKRSAFAKEIFDCYAQSLPKKWERLGFTYTRKGKDENGKNKVEISANVLAKDWSTAAPCSPLAPASIVKSFLDSTGNTDRKFEYLMVTVENNGNVMVLFDGKP